MCRGLTEQDLRAVVTAGAWSADAVAAACGAATDCGACAVLVDDFLAEAAAEATA